MAVRLSALNTSRPLLLRRVHITRARARAHQACARRETRLAFTCARKSSSTLLQLLARLRRVRILKRVYDSTGHVLDLGRFCIFLI
jgi:hypothetical protein